MRRYLIIAVLLLAITISAAQGQAPKAKAASTAVPTYGFKVIHTYPAVSQFWTYDPKAFLQSPVYAREWAVKN